MLSCCFPYCYKKPTIICYCQEDGVLMCKNHLYEHIVSECSTGHKNEPLWVKPTDECKASLITEINTRIKELIEQKVILIENFRQEIEDMVEKLVKNIGNVESGINNYIKCIAQICKIIEVPRKNENIIEKALILSTDKGISELENDILSNNPELKQILRPIELPSASKQILDYFKKNEIPISHSEPHKFPNHHKKRPKSAFNLFYADWMRERKRNNSAGTLREAAADWSKLTYIEKTPYVSQSKELWGKYYKERFIMSNIANDGIENDKNCEENIQSEIFKIVINGN